MSFLPGGFEGSLGALDEVTADRQPFGIVKVDNEGRIQLYNRYEAELAGVTPESAKGKNFFTEVAPCCNNSLVFGRFKKGLEAGQLDYEINYTFTYKMKPTNVKLRLKHDTASNTNWVFVKKA